jgi:hypothetical protein
MSCSEFVTSLLLLLTPPPEGASVQNKSARTKPLEAVAKSNLTKGVAYLCCFAQKQPFPIYIIIPAKKGMKVAAKQAQ